MQGLLKKDVHLIWTSDMERDLNTIEQSIASTTKLVHHSPRKPIITETDASLNGFRAALIQDGRPVKFLSKSLTKTEADYAHIERELLAVLFAVEKLHAYTFGRLITVHTDHKPLELIFQKPISLAPTCLQRMLLHVAKHDMEYMYVGTNSVLLADTLSRLIKLGQRSTWT